jgi:hypothetical protein
MVSRIRNLQNRTKFTQEATVTVKPWAIASQAESFFVNSYKQNATKGREIMEKAITIVKAEAEEKLKDLEKIKTSAEENFKSVLPTAKHV